MDLSALADRWLRLLPDARPTFDDLVRRYAEPGRHYHTLAHVGSVLQTIDRLAPGLVVTARSIEQDGSGLIEAVEAPRYRFLLGVQWHPERMWRREPACARLFQALIRAAIRMQVG